MIVNCVTACVMRKGKNYDTKIRIGQLVLFNRKNEWGSKGHVKSNFMKLYTYRTPRKSMLNRNKLHTSFAFDNING